MDVYLICRYEIYNIALSNYQIIRRYIEPFKLGNNKYNIKLPNNIEFDGWIIKTIYGTKHRRIKFKICPENVKCKILRDFEKQNEYQKSLYNFNKKNGRVKLYKELSYDTKEKLNNIYDIFNICHKYINGNEKRYNKMKRFCDIIIRINKLQNRPDIDVLERFEYAVNMDEKIVIKITYTGVNLSYKIFL